MSDNSTTETSSTWGSGTVLGLAAVACVACCSGPILAVLGAIVALGVVSTIFIGAAGLLVTAAAVVAFVAVRERRRDASWAVRPVRVPVELSRRSP